MLNMMLLLFGRCCTIDMQQKIALCHQFPVSPIFAYHFLALCRNSNTLANAEPYTYLWPPEMSYGNLNKKCAYVWPTIPSPSKTEDAHRTFRIRCTAVLFLFFFFILLTIAHCISCASGVICCDDLARVEGKKTCFDCFHHAISPYRLIPSKNTLCIANTMYLFSNILGMLLLTMCVHCTVHKKAILFIYLLLMISSMEIYNNNQRLSLNTCLLFSAVGQNGSVSLSLLPNMWRIDQQHFQRLEIKWFNVQHYIPLNTLSSKVDKKKCTYSEQCSVPGNLIILYHYGFGQCPNYFFR